MRSLGQAGGGLQLKDTHHKIKLATYASHIILNLGFRSKWIDISTNLSSFFCVPEPSALLPQSIILVVVARTLAVL